MAGREDGLFIASATLRGTVDEGLRALLDELDELAYDTGQAVATARRTAWGFQLTFATWAPGTGLATVRVDAERRPPR